jgi:hypothetical protein
MISLRHKPVMPTLAEHAVICVSLASRGLVIFRSEVSE